MITEIILLIILIFLNGIFAAAEIAFLSVNKITLKQEVKKQNKRAIKVHKLLEDPSRFLATIQIGITLAGFLASAFAAETFADYIVELINITVISKAVLKNIVVIIVTIILSYFTLVFGELIPKRLALAYPEKISYGIVNLISILMKAFYPFVWFLTLSTNFFSKIFGIKETKEEKLTEEEIKKIIAEGNDEGVIESGEKNLIFNIFEFNDTSVENVMTKKEDMAVIDINLDGKSILNNIKKGKYTRFPVYDKDINNIIGILNVKDLLISYSKNSKLDLKKIIRKPFFVNASDKIDDVFRLMQNLRVALAVVKDEKGNVVGLVTLEDAIEEIVGNMYDEYDIEDKKRN